MATELKIEVASLLADYIDSSYQSARALGLVARLHESEQAQFKYLPNPNWMLQVGYELMGLGIYLLPKHGAGGVLYKVEVLSQTSMVLLFRDDHFVAGQQAESNEQLIAFLQEHQFPIPPCK